MIFVLLLAFFICDPFELGTADFLSLAGMAELGMSEHE
jgi:hypothetical protein